jgi:hypothetical protein
VLILELLRAEISRARSAVACVVDLSHEARKVGSVGLVTAAPMTERICRMDLRTASKKRPAGILH